MVPDFMGDHIGLGEITRCAESFLEVAIEREVDVDLLIARTIKRPHRRLPHAAGGLHCTIKQHQLWLTVLQAFLLEDRVPGILGVGQYGRREVRKLVLVRPACLPDTCRAACALCAHARAEAHSFARRRP